MHLEQPTKIEHRTIKYYKCTAELPFPNYYDGGGGAIPRTNMAHYFVNNVTDHSFKVCKFDRKVLLVGLNCIDIVNNCKEFPKEDGDANVTSQLWAVGGNAANTARVLSQHKNIQVDLFCGLSKKNESQFVIDNLKSYGLNLEYCPLYEEQFPTSCCIINSQNGSRTILHCNHNFPSLKFKDFERIVNVSSYNIIHFGGRDLPDVSKMIDHVMKVRGKNKFPIISGEMEKPKRLTELEALFQPKCDILIISKDIGRAKGFQNSKETLAYYASLELNAKILICPWGESGAGYAKKSDVENTWDIEHVPSFKIEDKAIDTLGAGDSFNAGLLYGILSENSVADCTKYACFLAKEKCVQDGFKDLLLRINKCDSN